MRAVNHASKPSSTPCRSNSVSRQGNGRDKVTLADHDMHDVSRANNPSSLPQEFDCASQESGGDKMTLGERVTQTGQYSEFTLIRRELPSDSLLPLQHQTIPYQSSSYPLHQVSSNRFQFMVLNDFMFW